MPGSHRPVNRTGWILLTVVLVLGVIGLSFAHPAQAKPKAGLIPQNAVLSSTPTSAAGLIPLTSTAAPTRQPAEPVSAALAQQSLSDSVLFSIRNGTFYQFYLYTPLSGTLTQLTDTSWSLADPALSPDGAYLAFSSNLNGYWDIYVLNLRALTLVNFTQSPAYDGAPSWSPDSRWIAYETYLEGSLEIALLPVSGEGEAVRVTNHPGADLSPAWSPDGRYLLYTSNASGDEEVLRTDLQVTDDRTVNLSRQSSSDDRSPVWSTDGSTVFWSRAHNGARQIVRYDPVAGSLETLAAGSRPLVSPDGKSVLILNEGPQDTQAVVISSGTGKSLYLPVLLPGEVMGMTWVTTGLLPALEQALRVLDPDGAAPVPPAQTHDRSGSNTLSALEGVNVPQPYLTSNVLPGFNTLRQQVELAVGWNFMDILENAFVPITQPSAPEMEDSWLYTGRAVALNTAPLYGGWMCVVREDYYGQTYWRVFLKTRYQDGSQGLPIRGQVWDFTTRTSGDTSAYEQGGSLARAPEGYWVDFTSLAAQYGWSRVPAVPIWRSYMDGALYNLYVQTGSLSWLAAMRELYPPEALATATRVPTLGPTPAARP